MSKRYKDDEEITNEIFGVMVKEEVKRAKKALRDFADFYTKIRENYKAIEARLDACTRKGEAADVMMTVRRRYMQ